MTRNYPTYARTLVLAPYSYAFTDDNDMFFMTVTETTNTYLYGYRGNDPTSSNLMYSVGPANIDMFTVTSFGKDRNTGFLVTDGTLESYEIYQQPHITFIPNVTNFTTEDGSKTFNIVIDVTSNFTSSSNAADQIKLAMTFENIHNQPKISTNATSNSDFLNFDENTNNTVFQVNTGWLFNGTTLTTSIECE